MELREVAHYLDPMNDQDIEALDERELLSLVYYMTDLLGLTKETLLKHYIRDLRRRVIYDIIPSKVLRKQGTRKQFKLRDDIQARIESRLTLKTEGNEKKEIALTLRKLAVELSQNRAITDHTGEIINLLKNSGAFCCLCGYRFRQNDTSVDDIRRLLDDTEYQVGEYDNMKPLSVYRDLRQIRLDHIVSIDSCGSNEPPNLQILCNQCNSGKSNYMSYAEPRISSGYKERRTITQNNLLNNGDVQLFYAVVSRDRGCQLCHKTPQNAELTVKPWDPERFFLFDNLVTICYECDDYKDRWEARQDVTL